MFDSRITARQLLNHTSGISDRTLPEKSLPQPNSPAEAVGRPGSLLCGRIVVGSGYTFNYDLAARLDQRVRREVLRHLRTHIFEPAGMRDTVAIDVAPRDLPADYHRGYAYAYGFSVAVTESSV